MKSIISRINNINWDFKESNTNYLTHNIHRYSGKFIPQIANNAIQILSKKNDLILDPYCGSGTTLLEAKLVGRHSIGIDLNPLAVLISKVKNTIISRENITRFQVMIEEKMGSLMEKNFGVNMFIKPTTSLKELEEIVYSDFRWDDEWYSKWFQKNIKFELIAIHNLIRKEPNGDLRNLALVAFSDIIRKCSNANSSYPNVMFDKNRKTLYHATPLFFERLQTVSKAVINLNQLIKSSFNSHIIHGNSTCMPIDSNSINAVVTHPPYIGSIPYAEYSQLSLKWLGYDYKDIDKILTGGIRQRKDVLSRFENDYSNMIKETFRVLKPDGKFFVLIGYPTIRGKQINLPKLTKDIALSVGFKFLHSVFRNGINRRSNQMGKEALIFLYKP